MVDVAADVPAAVLAVAVLAVPASPVAAVGADAAAGVVVAPGVAAAQAPFSLMDVLRARLKDAARRLN